VDLKRAFLQLVCILLLLFAQHGALTHAIWHAHEHLPAQIRTDTDPAHDHDDTDDGQPLSQSSLCGFDLAFGQVLGGVHSACLHFVAAGSDAEREAQPLHARLSVEPVPALSRGPPFSL
jgi:hypothetical protein